MYKILFYNLFNLGTPFFPLELIFTSRIPGNWLPIALSSKETHYSNSSQLRKEFPNSFPLFIPKGKFITWKGYPFLFFPPN